MENVFKSAPFKQLDKSKGEQRFKKLGIKSR